MSNVRLERGAYERDGGAEIAEQEPCADAETRAHRPARSARPLAKPGAGGERAEHSG